jgi:PAS domain S-box-containing protein
MDINDFTRPKEGLLASDFHLLAHAIPHALITINNKRQVIFANQQAQNICFSKASNLTPFLPLEGLIDPSKQELVGMVYDTYKFKKNISRPFEFGTKTYLAESRIEIEKGKLLGCSLSLIDITQNRLRDKQHELFYQVSSALSAATHLHQVLKVALTQIMQSMNVTAANIMLYERESGTLQVKIDSKTKDHTADAREFRLGEGVAGKCAQELKPYSVHDISTSSLFAQKTDLDSGALLAVPLASRGRLLGVINVSDTEPRYFTESEVQFLTIIANDIAIALENSMLYERLNHKVKLLSKLFWISSFTGVKTLDTRIQRIVRLIAELLDADDCCIFIHSTVRNKLVLRYQKDLSSPLPLQVSLDSPSLSKTVLTKQETIMLNEPVKVPEVTIFKKYTKIRNIICGPLHVNQKPIGVLYVINKRNGQFDEEDKHMLTITSHRIGTIIENAQLLRKVEAEKDLLDNIIKYTNEGVAVLDGRKRVVIWNGYLEELTGLNSNEIVGLPSYKILYNRLGLKKLTRTLYSQDNSQNKSNLDSPMIEEEMRGLGKERVWLGSVYSHLYDANHNVEYTIIVFRNISKEKEFIEAKNEFVSLTTHELRTPLTAIKGYLSMILSGDSGKISNKQEQYFGKAYQATERLVNLVEDLLDVVRIDEERVIINPIPCCINNIITESLEGYSMKAKTKNITLEFHSDSSIQVMADPEKVKHVLCNLVDNAIKYTKERGKVVVTLQTKKNDLIIGVRDTGVGIQTKHLKNIFDRFVRVPNSLSVKAGGTGLGLYIVRSFVEKQGGTIWVTSQINKGSTFYFSLPLNLLPTTEHVKTT